MEFHSQIITSRFSHTYVQCDFWSLQRTHGTSWCGACAAYDQIASILGSLSLKATSTPTKNCDSQKCPIGVSNTTPVERHSPKWTETNVRVPWDSHSMTWHHRKPQLVERRDKDGWELGRVPSASEYLVPGKTISQNLGGETRVTVHLWDLGHQTRKGQHRKNCGSGATQVCSWSQMSQIWLKGKNLGQLRSLKVVTRFLEWGSGNVTFPNPLHTALTRNDLTSGVGLSLLK